MKIGDIKTDKYYMKFIWSACINCGIERWVRLVKGKPRHNKCPVCGVKRELYPYKNDKDAYIQSYGIDLKSHYDTAENKKYRNRIFCLDCTDYETCKGSLWEHCPTRAEVLELIRSV